jgi:hypothetical protein
MKHKMETPRAIDGIKDLSRHPATLILDFSRGIIDVVISGNEKNRERGFDLPHHFCKEEKVIPLIRFLNKIPQMDHEGMLTFSQTLPDQTLSPFTSLGIPDHQE